MSHKRKRRISIYKRVIIFILCMNIAWISIIASLLLLYSSKQITNRYFFELEKTTHNFEMDLKQELGNITAIEENELLKEQEKIQIIASIAQPIIDTYTSQNQLLGIGYYSKSLNAIVAISQNLDHLLGYEIQQDHPSYRLYIDESYQREISHVFRGRVLRYAKRIYYNSEIVGHIWTNIPVYVYKESMGLLMNRTIILFFIGIAISFLFALFIKKQIKTDMDNFVSAVRELTNNPSRQEVSCNTLKLSHEFDFLLTTYKNVVNRKEQLIEELTISTRLAALGDIVAVIAHDIKNSISNIKMRAELALSKSREKCAIEDFKKIISYIDSLNLYLETILFFGKSSTKIYTTFHLNELINDLTMVFGPVMMKKNIEFKVIGSERDIMITGDKIALGQAFMNVLTNSIDATSAGGQITIDIQTGKDDVVFSISDTGKGIPDEIKDNIFKRFFTTKGDKGTGIGLAITKAIVLSHGGKVWAESEVGTGTTFYIQLKLNNINELELFMDNKQSIILKINEIREKLEMAIVQNRLDDEEVFELSSVLDEYIVKFYKAKGEQSDKNS